LFDELGANELKLDLIDLLGFPAFDMNFERILDPYSSFGLGLFLMINDSTSRNWTDKLTLSPFYRFYFFNKKTMVVLVFLLKYLLNFHLANMS